MTIDKNGILRDYTQNDINHACYRQWCVVNHGATRTDGLLDQARDVFRLAFDRAHPK